MDSIIFIFEWWVPNKYLREALYMLNLVSRPSLGWYMNLLPTLLKYIYLSIYLGSPYFKSLMFVRFGECMDMSRIRTAAIFTTRTVCTVKLSSQLLHLRASFSLSGRTLFLSGRKVCHSFGLEGDRSATREGASSLWWLWWERFKEQLFRELWILVASPIVNFQTTQWFGRQVTLVTLELLFTWTRTLGQGGKSRWGFSSAWGDWGAVPDPPPGVADRQEVAPTSSSCLFSSSSSLMEMKRALVGEERMSVWSTAA